MVKRIKKADWESLLSSLSERNRFRPITVEGVSGVKADSTARLYFIGVRLREESEGMHLDVYACELHDPRVGFLHCSAVSPESLSVDETRQEGVRLLTVTHGRREKMRLRFAGPLDPEVRRDEIAKLAYFLYERRGGLGGSALEDWGDAERLFSDWERLIEQKFI
jgi:hypothetical protein